MKDERIVRVIDEIIEAIRSQPDYGIMPMINACYVNWFAGEDMKKVKGLFDELNGYLKDYENERDNPVFKPFFDDIVYLNYTWRKYRKVKKYLKALKEYVK